MIYIFLRPARLYFPGAYLFGYIHSHQLHLHIEEHLEAGLCLFFPLSMVLFLHPFGLPFCFAVCLKITCVREQGECQNMLRAAP